MDARRTTVSVALAVVLSGGSAVVAAAQESEPASPSTALWVGYFAAFRADGLDLEVPAFVVTFPDGGEAVIRGVLTASGAYDGLDDFAEVSISGAGWTLSGVVEVHTPPPPGEGY